MALTYTVDYALPELTEPGFWRFYSTRELAERGQPSDDDSYKDIMAEPATKTLMLTPRQLQPDFLNTHQQLDSILRLSDLTVNATDTLNLRIFEAAAFGNSENPFIFHEPVGPTAAFPSAVGPGAGGDLTGISTPYSLVDVTQTSQYRDLIYSQSVTGIPTPPYAPATEIGDSTDAKWLAETKERLPANQGLFFRWSQPAAQVGFPATYWFLVGQYALKIKAVICEVWRDTSPHGDRTAWTKVQRAPLWSVNDTTAPRIGSVVSILRAESDLAHDRSLLWLPFRRHQVLLLANTNQWALITVRPAGRRLEDDSDWDITRSDTVAVQVLSPAPGRIQIQKLKYPEGPRKIQSPTVTLDYTPGVAPTITISEDSDHGSTLTATRSQPPAYTIPVNDADDCPPAVSDPATDQSRTYGVELTFTASTDERWTPFFYGYSIEAARTFATRPTTPFTVSDTHAADVFLQEAQVSAGTRPGDGRLTARVVDEDLYPFTPYYYRSGYPVQLADGATVVFTGWSEPTELQPLRETGGPRLLTLSAVDRWKQLADTFLQDQRDWTEYGHIDVVLFVMQQAGIDTTGADVPADYTPGVKTGSNTPLGLGQNPIAAQTGEVKAPWKPRDDDTAASYILRIVEIFTPGWVVGFHNNGVPFYHPRTYYTAPETTFYASEAAAAAAFVTGPLFREAQFRTIEPEANVIQVIGGAAADGGKLRSGLWIDWASIRNPLAKNYLGKWRALVVPVGGAFNCSQLNFIARAIFQETRRRRIVAEFEGDFVPGIKVGRVVTLGGYGNYRLTDYQAEFSSLNWHPATYSAEFLDSGYGV